MTPDTSTKPSAVSPVPKQQIHTHSTGTADVIVRSTLYEVRVFAAVEYALPVVTQLLGCQHPAGSSGATHGNDNDTLHVWWLKVLGQLTYTVNVP